MNAMTGLLDVLMQRHQELWQLFVEHMQMTSSAVLLSLIVGVPLGIAITGSRRCAAVVLGLANITQAIPSLGLLAVLVPIVGIGQPAAVIMVIVYALLPIIKNTYVGMNGIDPTVLKAARGIGMSDGQILAHIRLPLAVPYIMGGVRISAVTAVGTVTIGAFAGAGGLGWMINLGLNANDVNLVLLGAIPACLLALALDFVLGVVERALTPEGTKPVEKIRRMGRRERLVRYTAAGLAAVLVLVAPAASSLASVVHRDASGTVVVGGENFTEALILGNIYSQMIQRHTDLTVDEKFNLDGTLVTMSALESGKIDMFTDYTGVIAPNILKLGMSTDTDEVYRQVHDGMAQSYDAKVSKPIGFSNTYVLAVTKRTSRELGITSLSQLVAHAGELRLGCTTAFTQREDLLPKMEKNLGVSFASVEGLEGNIRYQALGSGKVDVVDAYETDAMLEKMDLVPLKDDIGFFPPYQAVSIARKAILSEHPELADVLSKLDGAITTDQMRAMNYQVDVGGRTPRDVAIEFLNKEGLI
ncbi:ABC transporter permease/substrate-binding protein [Bifidobacterium scardovii]|uniref:ABC transporter substrate-binding protein n=1 Tax=Bifidobacterium scardovii TaxID=158787 RepID=A0A087DGY4_9BIFI|nr:ABC transporter permease/substrate-binding protein [Bifidobacterium scardovii]KFI94784.1 ABC transporter substrate-binding protein [Bifidobacterium scardovii]MDK6350714.1 ABC transporter permease/substrate-binding protein [Bifidobacterium scardovii]MDU2420979.1 ABC transporter permease/substrate-binding protein [Bifidobacterium scardovii]MDU8981944.1 ABC transporter permease/substrate-binding protein [Bifidobacterium scardovii]BAQ31989.1 putative glycine betaine/L-proline ABC transporter pe